MKDMSDYKEKIGYPIYVNNNLLNVSLKIKQEEWPSLCDHLIESGVDHFELDLSDEDIKLTVDSKKTVQQICYKLSQFLNK